MAEAAAEGSAADQALAGTLLLRHRHGEKNLTISRSTILELCRLRRNLWCRLYNGRRLDMQAMQDDPVGRYLLELIQLVARATPGFLYVEQGTDRRYRLTTARGQAVAMVHRRVDAEVFARDRLDLRALVLSVSEVIGLHHDRGDGRCNQDGQLLPCATLRELQTQLAPRAESAREESA